MGLEQSARGEPFTARCDDCDTALDLHLSAITASMRALKNFGWVRTGYTPTAQHYLWACPKCKNKITNVA